MEVGGKGGGRRKRGRGREEGESTVRCVWGRGWEGARRATLPLEEVERNRKRPRVAWPFVVLWR